MRTRMISIIGLAISLAAALPVRANSYVGSGGSEGDVELLVTLMQIKESFEVISTKGRDKTSLCECNKTFEGRGVCEPLKALNEPQIKFCHDTLNEQASQMVKLIDHREDINIRWTNSPIEVFEEGGHKRAADAVASRSPREIVINLKRFLELKQPERVLLLTHELFHLTDLNGHPLTDVGAVGPFTGEQGSRHLVDAMAAAASVSVGVFPKDIQRYRAKLSRSQAWRSNWFTLDLGGASAQSDQSSNFAVNSYTRTQLAYRYQWNHWGIMGEWRSETNDKTVLDTIKVNENLSILGAGVTYRLFPAADPLTFFGQSHFLFHALAEHIQADYKFNDGYTGASDSTSVFGANVGATYYLPLFWGFWLDAGVAYEIHPYKYTNPLVKLNYNQNIFSEYIGVSYAF